MICLLTFCTYSCFAQHASIENDTISYNAHKYHVGDTVHLAYGSAGNKSFEFVQTGSMVLGLRALDKRFSKVDVVVDKVFKQRGKYYLRGKQIEGHAPGFSIFIDVEGAIDNKEMKE
jgi:hypothetical protein